VAGTGCPFAPRCPIARDVCTTVDPVLSEQEDTSHRAACHATGDPSWPAEPAAQAVS
jgi:ABC-type dipeptide/oligopeptide/nickel transport system ATPase component